MSVPHQKAANTAAFWFSVLEHLDPRALKRRMIQYFLTVKQNVAKKIRTKLEMEVDLAVDFISADHAFEISPHELRP